MNENKSLIKSQTSINFNEICSPLNLKSNFLHDNKLNNVLNKNVILKKKGLDKYYKDERTKNLIRTRSDNYFKQYNFGVPRYHEFNPKFSNVIVEDFLNEKIIKTSLSPKSKSKIMQAKQNENTDGNLNCKNLKRFKLQDFNDDSILSPNMNCKNQIIINDEIKFDKKKNLKLVENNIIPNLNNSIKKFDNIGSRDDSKYIIQDKYKEKSPNNYNSKNLHSVNNYSGKYKRDSFDNKELKMFINFDDSYSNFLHGNVSEKDHLINYSFKNYKDYNNEISDTNNNPNNYFNNSGNHLNGFEDIFEDNCNKNYINLHRSNFKDQTLNKNNKNELSNITCKNFTSSFSKDYNITFLKKQNEREKNITHEINRLKVGSDIPQFSKEFYLLQYNEALLKEKIKQKEKISQNIKLSKKFDLNLSNILKKGNHKDYLKFENEFNKNLFKTKFKEDNFESKRNFNYNFDSDKYSNAMHLNTLINFPVILGDSKNFEEILTRNTNNILDRGKKVH